MINNLHDQLKNFYNNRGSKNEAGGASDVIKRLKEKRDAMNGKTVEDDQQTDTAAEETNTQKSKPNYVDSYTKSKNTKTKDSENDTATTDTTDDSKLTSEEKRQAELKKILEKIEAEEAQRYPNRNKTNSSASTDGVITTTDPKEASEAAANATGVEGFLNDLPLFNEFKTSLMDAFKNMDSATSGSISAQYELNYTSMQYIANAAGGYEYKETSVNLKFDLNYVKAAAGDTSGADIAKALDGATDFESLMSKLEEVASGGGTQAEQAEKTKGIPELKNMKPEDFLKSMEDYWSPESTSGRIVDFATAFFPLSDAYKNGGDTEEARQEFADMMGKAIQKGFDQAMGTLGSVPKNTMDGINKTHELTFKGLEDFVKNGMSQEKEEQGVYKGLQNFSMSFEMSYSEKSVSVSAYNSKGQAQNAQKTSELNTEA